MKKKEHTQPQGDKELEQVTCESDAKLDHNHEHSSGMQESIEAEGTEERVLTSHTEMCEVCEVASVEEGHDFERDELHRALKSALEAQVIVCLTSGSAFFSDYVGSGVGPTIKYAEGGAERQDSVTNGLRQMNEPPGARARVALTGPTVAEYFRDVEEAETRAAAATAVALNKKALATFEGQSSDRIAKINGLTKATALLVKGMTIERFLQNGEIVGVLKRLKHVTSADLTALEKEGLDRKTNHQDLTKAKTEDDLRFEQSRPREGNLGFETGTECEGDSRGGEGC